MSDKVKYTDEERDAASNSIDDGYFYLELRGKAIEIQCELNRLKVREKQARELLESLPQTVMEGGPWFDSYDSWLLKSSEESC